MRTIILTAVCALGLGLAASTGASAAPLGAALEGVNMSSIQEAQVVVVTPGRRHRPRCERVTRCRVRANGVRVCRTERVCHRF
jgi:hypothetical protein